MVRRTRREQAIRIINALRVVTRSAVRSYRTLASSLDLGVFENFRTFENSFIAILDLKGFTKVCTMHTYTRALVILLNG